MRPPITPAERARIEQGAKDAEEFLQQNPHLRGPVTQVAATLRSRFLDGQNR